MHEQITVTEEGLKKLQDELNYLKTIKKQEIKDAIKTAKEFGDLSENSEYEAARTEQAQVEGRIAELEEMLHVAQQVFRTRNVAVVGQEFHEVVQTDQTVTLHHFTDHVIGKIPLV